MGNPKLSPAEQRVYDQWKTVCERNFKSLKPAVQLSCVVMKKQLEQDAQQKQQDIQNAARFQLVQRQLDAITYITQTVDARQAEATLLLGALMRASGEYDQILQVRAAAPIAGEIAFGLATSFIPELAVLGRLTRRYGKSASWRAIAKTAKKSTATSWEQLADEIMTSTKVTTAGQGSKTVERFADAIDQASKHVVDSVWHPLQANKELDEASRDRLKAFFAKNQILSGIIGDINRTMAAVAIFEPILFRLVFWYGGADLVNWLKQKFINADLDLPATNKPADYDVVKDVILYDMLRLYTKTYFTVNEVPLRTGRAAWELGPGLGDPDIEGLDEAQRKMIFAKFGKVPWRDASRPAVNSYQDLLKYWGGTLVTLLERQRGG